MADKMQKMLMGAAKITDKTWRKMSNKTQNKKAIIIGCGIDRLLLSC